MTTKNSYKDTVNSIPANIDNTSSIKLNVRSYAGYADVPFKQSTAELFYWFFESQEFHPEFSRNNIEIGETPLIIWLNGGPGAPSTLGLFLENGPYRMTDTDDRGELVENKYSWNNKAHLIYWDQPIWTGYSRVEGEEKLEKEKRTYVENEAQLSEIFYDAMQRFFEMHPEYSKCPVYLTGESYAGKYIPNIAMKIHEKNQTTAKNPINLQGIAVGDGWINPKMEIKFFLDYAKVLGYLDIHQYDQLLVRYNVFVNALHNEDWIQAYNVSNKIVEDISILGGGFDVYDIRSFSGIPMGNVKKYMLSHAVKKALNIPETQEWNCADNEGPVAAHLIPDNMSDTSELYGEFIAMDKYKVLMYAATFDTACGAYGTEYLLYNQRKWNQKDDEIWKTIVREIWALPSSKPKGFFKKYKNLTQIVLPNSGHQVPYYLPEISRDMIYKWIFNEKFPTYRPIIHEKVIETVV